MSIGADTAGAGSPLVTLLRPKAMLRSVNEPSSATPAKGSGYGAGLAPPIQLFELP